MSTKGRWHPGTRHSASHGALRPLHQPWEARWHRAPRRSTSHSSSPPHNWARRCRSDRRGLGNSRRRSCSRRTCSHRRSPSHCSRRRQRRSSHRQKRKLSRRRSRRLRCRMAVKTGRWRISDGVHHLDDLSASVRRALQEARGRRRSRAGPAGPMWQCARQGRARSLGRCNRAGNTSNEPCCTKVVKRHIHLKRMTEAAREPSWPRICSRM